MPTHMSNGCMTHIDYNTERKMITYIHGNIFDSNCPILVNPVNCVGVMGAGLAAEFKQRFHGMFSIYRLYCKSGLVEIGKLWMVNADTDSDKKILLFPTKIHWQDQSKLEWIEEGLQDLSMLIYSGIIKEPIAMPKVGCGLGGLNWESQVKPLVEKYLADADVQIEVYE